LYQILCNILHNASKFTAENDRIAVTAQVEGGELVLTIADSGIGIARDKLETVFEMFSQLDQPPERAKEGLGIGLALVKQLVALHGGSVEARSDGPGTGSTFIIRLPGVSSHAPELQNIPDRM